MDILEHCSEKRVIRLLKGVADELRIDSTGHRVAILEYSSLAKASKWRRYYFEHISSDPALAEVINQLPHIQGITDTGSALRVVIDEYVPSRRNGIPLIIFTITDGYYRDHEIVQKNIAKLLSFPNTHLFAATPSSSYNLKGLLSLTNGEISRLAYGQDALERSKQMLQQFTSCRSRQNTEIRRKPQNKALLSTTRSILDNALFTDY
ncbi:unnamed protein product [Anisakis simplex]|uniref:VWFA domain-containing protein n=1 Tax=Anisakis simplex TaxID=6269 RepID=A0A0M3J1K0_ANISI|nr:unnamed protein product [Anisakis simplex]